MENNKLNQKEFLSLFPCTRFRYIHDVNKNVIQGNDMLDMSWNKKGYGIFFTVNGFPATGEAKEPQLLSLNANYVDIDFDHSLSQTEKDTLIQDIMISSIEMGVPSPTIMNRTKNGSHLFWLYSTPTAPTQKNIAKWRDIQKRLVQVFKGDKGAVDPARVLRVPYALHLKEPSDPFEIKITSYKSECMYTLEELDEELPRYSDEETSKEKITATELLLKGVPVGEGLRHGALKQMAGLLLKGANTPEKIAVARLNYYDWDKKVVGSPEQSEMRKKELDNVFEWVLKLEMTNTNIKTNIISHGQSAIITCFTDIQSEPINWLWTDRIALGKLTLIAGDPGIGKSLISIGVAATISIGGSWPCDGTIAPIGDTIFISAEDDPADTVKPRLEAAGADCNRVHILKAIRCTETDSEGKPTERMFSLKNDIHVLENVLSKLPNCKLIIVDPISAYLDGSDSHANADVRGLLAPLSELAAKHKVAVVTISHLNKNNSGNAMYRTMGSLAFVAAARAAFLVTKDKDTEGRVLILPVKNNIAKVKTGLAYSVIQSENGYPVIAWESEPVEMTADDALSLSESSSEEQGNTDWAVDFLEDLLRNGPVSASDVYKEAKKVHIGDKALRRAQKKLGIKPYKSSFSGGWFWAMQGHEGSQDVQDTPQIAKGNLDNVGHLGETTKKSGTTEEIHNDAIGQDDLDLPW